MAWVETRITRTSQPQDVCGVDYSFGANMAVVPAVSLVNLATSLNFDEVGTGRSLSVSSSGIAANFGSSGLVEITGGVGDYYQSAVASTIVVRFFAKSSQAYEHVVNLGGYNRLGFRQDSSNRLALYAEAGRTYFNRPPNSGFINVVASVNAGGSVRRLWINGKPATVGATGAGSMVVSNKITIGATVLASDRAGTYLNERVEMAAALPYQVSEQLGASLSENPWQIFEPEVSRIWVDDYVSAGGGATTVTTDASATYTIAGAAQSDSAAQYQISSVVTADAAASYAVRGSTAIDASASYTVAGSVQADAAASYKIASAVQQDATAQYAIRAAVTADASASYSQIAATSVTADASASYVVQGAVQQDAAASYAVRAAVFADAVASYALIVDGQVTADASASYQIRGAVQSDASLAYEIAGAVQSSASAGYVVQGMASADASAAYVVRGAVAADTVGSYLVDGAAVATATKARPAADVSNTGWTASTGSDLYAMLDEATPDALDYISTNALGSIYEAALNPVVYPGGAVQRLKFRASSSTGHSVIVRLRHAGATVRSVTQVLTDTDTEYSVTLTAPEIAGIASGVLSVQLESA